MKSKYFTTARTGTYWIFLSVDLSSLMACFKKDDDANFYMVGSCHSTDSCTGPSFFTTFSKYKDRTRLLNH